jgi:CRP-like cAMP-binding protein
VEVLKRFQILEVSEGNDIFRYNQDAELFYLIVKGTCEVLVPDPAQDREF